MIDRDLLNYVVDRIRPQLQADGGDLAVTRVDDESGTVYVALHGACVDCPMSAITLSQGVEKVLKEHVYGVERVLPDFDDMDMSDSTVKVSVVDEDGNFVGEKEIPASELSEKLER